MFEIYGKILILRIIVVKALENINLGNYEY